MESVILEQSMTTIIYLLAVSLDHAGSSVVAKNITEHGDFDLMKPGRLNNALIAVC